MHCSTSLTQLPLLPRLPRGLVGLLILGLLFHTLPLFTVQPIGILPSLTITPSLGWRARRCRYTRSSLSPGCLLKSQWPRLLVRLMVFAILLHLSGWTAVNPLTGRLLALPVAQTLVTVLTLKRFTATRRPYSGSWSSSLQRGYQGLFIFLLLSALMHTLSHLHTSSGGFWSLVGLGVSALSSDHAAEIAIDHDTPTHYHITLRGSFELVWEPRDNFEKWMVILFLRRLQRVGETRPFLRHHHLEEAFEVDSPTISHWTREVEAHSWHILSDRYRHQLHSLLPDAALSRVILKTWVPAFAHVPSP